MTVRKARWGIAILLAACVLYAAVVLSAIGGISVRFAP